MLQTVGVYVEQPKRILHVYVESNAEVFRYSYVENADVIHTLQ